MFHDLLSRYSVSLCISTPLWYSVFCDWYSVSARWRQRGDRPCAAMCVCLTFDSKFCHRTGIARSEGRGQGQRNKLCLAEALSLWIPPSKKFGQNLYIYIQIFHTLFSCFATRHFIQQSRIIRSWKINSSHKLIKAGTSFWQMEDHQGSEIRLQSLSVRELRAQPVSTSVWSGLWANMSSSAGSRPKLRFSRHPLSSAGVMNTLFSAGKQYM